MTDTPCLGASDAHVRSAQAILSGMTTDLNFVMVVQVDSECVSLWESLRPPAACLWCPPSESALCALRRQMTSKDFSEFARSRCVSHFT